MYLTSHDFNQSVFYEDIKVSKGGEYITPGLSHVWFYAYFSIP